MTGVLEGRETWTRMTVAISGSSGFIGSALVHRLEKRGARVLRLVRRPARSTREVSWDPARGSIDAGALEGNTWALIIGLATALWAGLGVVRSIGVDKQAGFQ